jgi:hypothetical protein
MQILLNQDEGNVVDVANIMNCEYAGGLGMRGAQKGGKERTQSDRHLRQESQQVGSRQGRGSCFAVRQKSQGPTFVTHFRE